MNKEWPSCQGTDTNQEFWQHEWEKHGTCSKLAIQTYFRTVLKLYEYVSLPAFINLQLYVGNISALIFNPRILLR